jgi:hypothetical protein
VSARVRILIVDDPKGIVRVVLLELAEARCLDDLAALHAIAPRASFTVHEIEYERGCEPPGATTWFQVEWKWNASLARRKSVGARNTRSRTRDVQERPSSPTGPRADETDRARTLGGAQESLAAKRVGAS